MLFTLAVLAVTVVFFMLGRYRTDIIAMCSMLALTLGGVLAPKEAFTGFSNNVIFITAGMFVISGAIVRSGLASVLSRKILGVAGKNTNALYMLVMFLAACIGSLVSNTGTVAIMMPIVVSMAMSIDESPSRFLMPLAFMSSIGGMMTLIGNSPNMVVNDVYVKAGFPTMTLFSFLPVGLVCFVYGMAVIAPATSYFLSRRKNEKVGAKGRGAKLRELADSYNLAQNMYRVTVPKKCPVSGRTLAELHLTERNGVVIQEIRRWTTRAGYFGPRREEHQIVPGPQTPVLPGDTLSVIGPLDGVQEMASQCGLQLAGQEIESGDRISFDSIGICELVIMSSSRLVNRTVTESGLREQFGITVLGIHRGDQYLLDNIKDRTLQSGDALLVQGTWENLTRLEEYSMHWVVVGRPKEYASSSALRAKIPLVASVLLLMIGCMAFNLVPTVVAVLIAAIALILGGCFKNMDEAYSVINWETLVMIACLMPMATAMENTGIMEIVSTHLVTIGTQYGPYVALAVVYAVASFMNIMISTTPVALLIAPVAMRIAGDLGYSPLPFLFAVATAASMCFASPFSTPSNALVMSAGRYTFLDYVKIGLPLQVLMGVVMVIALPWLFPFTAGS